MQQRCLHGEKEAEKSEKLAKNTFQKKILLGEKSSWNKNQQ